MPLTISPLRLESKLYPGVFFTLHLITVAKRIELDQALADVTEQFSRLWVELETVRNAGDAPEDTAKTLALSRESQRLTVHEREPIILRWGLKSVEGVSLDGDADAPLMPVRTADDVIQLAPEDLYREILEAVIDRAGLSPAKIENFELPTTSGAPVAGQTSNTSAPSADSGATTESVTAGDISPIL